MANGDATFKFDVVVTTAEWNKEFGSLGPPTAGMSLPEAIASIRELMQRAHAAREYETRVLSDLELKEQLRLAVAAGDQAFATVEEP